MPQTSASIIESSFLAPLRVIKSIEDTPNLSWEFDFIAPKHATKEVPELLKMYKKFFCFISKKAKECTSCEDLTPGKEYKVKIFKNDPGLSIEKLYSFAEKQKAIFVGPKGLLFVLGKLQELSISWVISFSNNPDKFYFFYKGVEANEFELRYYNSSIALSKHESGYLLIVTEK